MTCQVVLRIELEQLTYKSPGIELKYRVFQIYGQKHVTLQNPDLHPEPMTEIFVAKIPRNIAIENLFKFFAQCGEIYQIRLLMDFSGSNRGKCFVQYLHAKASREAICCLHNEIIESGHRIVVKMSLNNNQLFLRSIPTVIPEEEVRQAIVNTIGEGLIGIIMKKSRTCERYYCFCTYRDHQFAIMAHKKSWPSLRIGNYLIDVHWAIPELLRYLDLLMSLQALMLRFLLGIRMDLLGLLSRISGRKLTLALAAGGEGSPLGSISKRLEHTVMLTKQRMLHGDCQNAPRGSYRSLKSIGVATAALLVTRCGAASPHNS
ncbi:putative RNA-binding protein 46-like Protein [Tribolium castaneum]|uniref:Putative RNA-binding protein 46-like Protein n=1 Tax=Tribolium castaneum TaxID=7070 RepID=A0A139WND4_TRICA|nr:putative RNA-binding protein 46-like Protein [Tribolium castaneum]